MVPMVHVVAWYRGTMVPMVGGYHGTGGAFDMILGFGGTFIRTDRFGSLTENDGTGGADLVGYFLQFVYGIKRSILQEIAKIQFWGTPTPRPRKMKFLFLGRVNSCRPIMPRCGVGLVRQTA